MDSKFESLKITDEEYAAVTRYCEGAWYTEINRILEDNIELDRQFLEKGVGLFNGYKPEFFNMLTNSISQIYSVMYKSKINGNQKQYLYRGMSKSEINDITNNVDLNKLLSTSTNLKSALCFTSSKEPLLAKIRLGDNIPVLDVNEILGEKYSHSNENEVIISPFTSISNSSFVETMNYENEKIDVWNIDIVSREPKILEDKEKEEYKKYIDDNYIMLDSLLKTYIELSEEIEYIKDRLKRETNDELLLELNEKETEFKDTTTKYSKIKTSLMKYMESICKEKELEIDKKYNEEIQLNKIKEKEKIEREEKERLELIESKRKENATNCILEINEKKQAPNKVQNEIEKQYNKFVEMSTEYKNLAISLGIKCDSIDIPKNEMDGIVNEINRKIEEMKQSMDLIKIDSNTTSNEDIDNFRKSVNENTQKLQIAENIISNFQNTVNQYEKYGINEIKKNLHVKVKEIINNSKKEELIKQRQELEKSKVNIFGKFLGKDKVKNLQLENISTKIKILNETEISPNNNGSIHEILYDIYQYSYSECEGQVPDNLKEVISAIDSNFKYDKNKVEEIGKQRSDKSMPAVIDEKVNFFNKNKIEEERLKKESITLNENLNEVRKKDSRSNFISEIQTVKTVVTDAHNYLDAISGYLTSNDEINRVNNELKLQGKEVTAKLGMW